MQNYNKNRTIYTNKSVESGIPHVDMPRHHDLLYPVCAIHNLDSVCKLEPLEFNCAGEMNLSLHMIAGILVVQLGCWVPS